MYGNIVDCLCIFLFRYGIIWVFWFVDVYIISCLEDVVVLMYINGEIDL